MVVAELRDMVKVFSPIATLRWSLRLSPGELRMPNRWFMCADNTQVPWPLSMTPFLYEMASVVLDIEQVACVVQAKRLGHTSGPIGIPVSDFLDLIPEKLRASQRR